MLNRRRSLSASLDIVALPLNFFVGLSVCAFIEGSFLSSKIFIYWALNRIAEVAGLSGIEKVSLLTLEVVLTSAMMLMVGCFVFSHTRTVIQQLARPAGHAETPNLALTNPIERVTGTTLETTEAESKARGQVVPVRKEAEFFKVFKPGIDRNGSLGKKLAA